MYLLACEQYYGLRQRQRRLLGLQGNFLVRPPPPPRNRPHPGCRRQKVKGKKARAPHLHLHLHPQLPHSLGPQRILPRERRTRARAEANRLVRGGGKYHPAGVPEQEVSGGVQEIQRRPQAANYKYYRQYACDEYKTFTDPLPATSIKRNTLNIWEQGFLSDQQEVPLLFDSNFECGNLERAYLREGNPYEYFLLVSNDTNTIGFNQWFYFRATNPNFKEVRAKFVIVNNNKKTNPNIGAIGISYFSLDAFKFHKVGWQKSHEGVCCNVKNNLRRDNLTFSHTLEFSFKLMAQDTVYFALTLPYSFTKLTSLISIYPMGFSCLGTTFCGNPIYVYRTGNRSSQKSIVVMARQHPSETSSSFVANGVIKRLQRDSPLISFLKKKYWIVVVPMANPDGVIHGNSRTNLLGYDINRKWEEIPNKTHSFEVSQIYNHLLKKLPTIEYLIDLHGHSKKLNSFAYFTTKKSLASIIAIEMADKLPWFKIEECLMAQTMPLFTLRWLSSEFLAVEKAITIQTSIHGWSDDKLVHPFSPQQMELIGSTFMEVLARIEVQKKMNKKQVKMLEFGKSHESSDSDPEGDYMKESKPEVASSPLPPDKGAKKVNPTPRKMRIKTVSSTFYKPTLSSTIRERLKTEYAVEKVDISPPSCSPVKVRMRKKTMTKYCRARQTNQGSKRRLTDCVEMNSSLTMRTMNYSEKESRKK